MDYIKGLPLAPHRCRSAPHQLPLATAVCNRAYITEKMILVADKLAAKDTENKQFLAGLFKYGTCFMGLVLVVGGTILGVNIKGTKLPSLARS